MSRRARLIVIAVLSLIGWTLATPAWAATPDSIDTMTAAFTVDTAARVHVDETVVYRFGTDSGRHGLTWTLLTREPYDDTSDAVYGISNVTVSSADASAEVQRSTVTSGRNAWLSLRIGSPDRVITTPTATYRISYDISGALRHFSSYDEFYWDVVSEDTPTIRHLDITTAVPGGVRAVTCFVGPVKSTQPCAGATVSSGTGRYSVTDKQQGDVVSIGAKIGSGLVSNPGPRLVTRADQAAREVAAVARVAGPIAAVVPPLLGFLLLRRRRDERYVGLPPGMTPAAGQVAPVAPARRIEIPVAFAPPRLTVAEAGMLADGRLGSAEVAGTLVGLAVRGVVTLGGDRDSASVHLANPGLPLSPHEDALLGAVFGGPGTATLSGSAVALGQTADLSTAGQIYRAQARMRRLVLKTAAERQWYRRLPGTAGSAVFGASGCAAVLVALIALAAGGSVLASMMATGSGILSPTLVVWLVVVAVSAIATLVVVRMRTVKGQRSADGTALTDQIEGFRKYLATAEAEQLRFEEGEDIYSKYLPWAIVFGLTERWAQVCQRLIDLGRLPNTPPTWYVGPVGMWSPYWIAGPIGHVTTAAMPPVPVSSGSSGFGGGSSFGGGGFSGGGGGGTSIGSW